MTSGNNTHKTETIKRIEPTDSYKMLGVWISPIGHNKGALDQLRQTSSDFNMNLGTSHLTREESIAAYVQHLSPKLWFQLPVLSLSQKECDQLTSITLSAFLPKIHINRNTARSIVHGPFSLGGIAIPNLHTLQGIDKLHLFLGHLRLQDDIGSLISIDLGYIQLLSECKNFFLNKNPAISTWVPSGWPTSLWEFTHKVDIQIDYPTQWLPKLSREHNLHLMPFFQTHRLKKGDLTLLNTCRLYLKVITLSDITSADGTYILQKVKSGTPIQGLTSNLDWPNQGKPTYRSWMLWRQLLSMLEERGKLIQPLGKWIDSAH